MAESALASEWRVYRRLLGARVRGEWQYRTSFATFLVAQASITALEFVVILMLLDVVPDLGGWTRHEVALLYGLATVPFAVSDVVVSPVERLSVQVRTGTFDRVLLRPASSLLQTAANDFELRRLGKLVPNLAVLVWAIGGVDVDWTAARLVALAVALVSGSVIFSALWVITASLSFWVVGAQEATNAMTYGGQNASQYPLHIYRDWIRVVMGWVLPLAFVAYVPAIYLVGAPNPLELPSWMILLCPVVAVASAAVAAVVWRIGIRHYQSTGS